MCRQARSVEDADCIRIAPMKHRGQGEIVPLDKKRVRHIFFMALVFLADLFVTARWILRHILFIQLPAR